jgi:hypothetical protein
MRAGAAITDRRYGFEWQLGGIEDRPDRLRTLLTAALGIPSQPVYRYPGLAFHERLKLRDDGPVAAPGGYFLAVPDEVQRGITARRRRGASP